jgi:hypothetical protein
MASFSENDEGQLDFRLLLDCAVTLYFRREYLDLDVDWLKRNGYTVHLIDCTVLTEFQRQVSRILQFKENFGYESWTGNLDALNDGYWNLDFTSVTGVVLCLLRFDCLFGVDRSSANSILDIIECNSRQKLLYGHRLFALVQTDDPEIRIDPIGCHVPRWNQRERLDETRRR